MQIQASSMHSTPAKYCHDAVLGQPISIEILLMQEARTSVTSVMPDSAGAKVNAKVRSHQNSLLIHTAAD